MKRNTKRRCGCSLRTARAGAMFGLTPPFDEYRAVLIEQLKPIARQLNKQLKPGQIALLSGPSGCGKSTLLRIFAGVARRERIVRLDDRSNDRTRRDGTSLVDLFPGNLEGAIRLLTRVGLGEPRLFTRSLSELSDGQRHRARLALALTAIQGRGGTIVIDEFGSLLDRLGARLLAASVRNVISGSARAVGVRLVAATAHDDLCGDLKPDFVVSFDSDPQKSILHVTGEREYPV